MRCHLHMLVVGIVCCAAAPAWAWKIESASVTLNNTFSTPRFTSVTFRQTYDVTPMIFAIATNQGGDSSALRIRNVTTTGFEIAQVEPTGNDGPHVPMTVHYVAVEPGLHTLPDGTVIEVGSIDTTTVQHGRGVPGGEGWDSVNFTNAFASTPAVLAHIQTMANESNTPPSSPSVPWLTTAVRNVTSNRVELALERSEVDDGPPSSISAQETIGYLAIRGGASGSFTDSGGATINYEAIYSSDTIRGWYNGCFTIGFNGTYSGPPLVIATENTHDGGDGGWMRRCSLSSTAVGLTEDEDIFRDSERNHTTERAGIVVFSQAFDANFSPPGAVAYFAADEGSQIGGPLADSSGNGNDGTRVGNADTVADGKVCRAAETVNDGDALNANVDVDGTIGDAGTVAFWFRPNWTNSGSERNNVSRVLFDASMGNKYFKLVKTDNANNFYPDNVRRELALLLEDSADGDFGIGTNADMFAAATWVHIAVTWDYAADRFQIYVDGSLRVDQSAGTNGSMPNLDTLYFGDNRSGYNPYNVTTPADGSFDEIYLYDHVRTQTQIQADMNATHPCAVINDFDVTHNTNALTCEPTPVTISALDNGGNVLTSYTGTVDLSTSTSNGDWSVVSGNGTLSDPTADDGQATYNFDAADNGTVTLGLDNTHADALTITATDGGVSDTSAVLTFRPYGFRLSPDPVPTQVANKPFSITLTAVGQPPTASGCTVIEEYSGNQGVDFWSAYVDPASNAAGTAVRIDSNPIGGSEAAATTVTINFTNGVSDAISVNYPDAGRIQFFAKDEINVGDPPAGSGTEIVVGGGHFVVRPFGLDIDFSNDRQNNGTGGASYAADETGSVFVKAGEDFAATLTAVQWQSADDGNSDGVPDSGADLSNNAATPNFGNEAASVTPADVALTRTLVAPAGGNGGTLTTVSSDPGFTGAAGDVLLDWNEAGILDLSARLSNYLNGGEDVTGTVNNVGRFYPDHFCLVSSALIDRSEGAPYTAAGCSDGFSYLDEDFSVQVTLKAQARGISCSDSSVTQNYDGAWSKFSSPFSEDHTDANEAGKWNLGAVDDPAGGATVLNGRIDPVANASDGDFSNGQLTFTLQQDIDRLGSAPDYTAQTPLNDVRLGINPIDTDNVALDTTDLTIGGDNYRQVGATALYFGRLFAENAFGTNDDAIALRMWARTEYCDNISGGVCDDWLHKTDDSCSLFTVSPPADTALGEASAGDGRGYYQRPTPAVSSDNYDFSASSGRMHVPDSSNHSGGWQLFYTAGGDGGDYLIPFDSHGYLRTAPGTASFGLYRGDDRIIYWREVFE